MSCSVYQAVRWVHNVYTNYGIESLCGESVDLTMLLWGLLIAGWWNAVLAYNCSIDSTIVSILYQVLCGHQLFALLRQISLKEQKSLQK